MTRRDTTFILHVGAQRFVPLLFHLRQIHERFADLAAARLAHPERFTTDTDPKILALPKDAWINQPAQPETETAAEPTAA